MTELRRLLGAIATVALALLPWTLLMGLIAFLGLNGDDVDASPAPALGTSTFFDLCATVWALGSVLLAVVVGRWYLRRDDAWAASKPERHTKRPPPRDGWW